jgi:integrase
LEGLVTNAATATNVHSRTLAWLEGLDAKYKVKLAKAGLVRLEEPQASLTVPQLADMFILQRTDVKESSRLVYGRAAKHLGRFFPRAKIDEITEADARDWTRFLDRNNLALSTVRKMTGVAKQMFEYAVQKRLLTVNPFRGLSTAVGEASKAFIDQSTVVRLIDSTEDLDLRLILALARFGGLRTPSEPLALTWNDIDFEERIIHVPQPKVAHHGKPYRLLPVFPELRPHLEDALAEASRNGGKPNGFVIASRRLSSYGTTMKRLCLRAGVEPWPMFFNAMRSSRQTELVDRYPLHVVCGWLGNSQVVAARHYLQITEQHFQNAAGLTPNLTPVTQGHGGTTAVTSVSRINEKTSKSGYTTKNDVPRQNLKTPFNGPNWT